MQLPMDGSQAGVDSEHHYDIVIPHYNVEITEMLAVRCLQTIAKYSKSYRVIWVQNGGEVPNLVAALLAVMPKTLIIYNVENMGFVKAANKGLRASTAPYVVLMNNDTEAAPYWLGKLEGALKWPIVLSGPRTNARGSWQGNCRPSNTVQVLPKNAMLAFFCVMMDRRVFDKVGYLDEDFGVGFGDDDNYCARVHAKGLRIALVPDLLIPHWHRTTFKALYSVETIKQMQQSAMAMYRAKLSKL